MKMITWQTVQLPCLYMEPGCTYFTQGRRWRDVFMDTKQWVSQVIKRDTWHVYSKWRAL